MAIWFERIELDYGRHSGEFALVRRDVLKELLGSGAGNGGANGGGNGGKGGGNGTNGGGNGSKGGGNGGGGAIGTDGSGQSPEPGRPFVILGRNGAGKSTLLEAPVRALFGFRRSRKEGRELHARREPWAGGPYRARLTVRTPGGALTFERDFDTDRIRVTEEGRQAPLFDAEANPSRTGETVRQYRQILRDAIGLDDFDHYRDTACIFQGGLLARGLSGDLLRVAAGGHTDVESAHAALRKEYGPITVEPIAPGVARRRKPGELELLSEEIEELIARAAEARSAEERRTPLVRAREECVARIDVLSGESERLEAAFETLSDGHRLETEAEATRARIRALEGAVHQLDEALGAFNLVLQREEAHAARYPTDFGERALALEEGLWPRLETIDAELLRLGDAGRGTPATSDHTQTLGDRRTAADLLSPQAASLGAFAIGLIGLIAAIAGFTLPGLLLLLGGLGMGGTLHARARSVALRESVRAERVESLEAERAEISGRIARMTDDLPDGDALSSANVASARREFEREAADRRLRDEAEATLRQAMDAARRVREAHEENDHTDRASDSRGTLTHATLAEATLIDGTLIERARARLDGLHGSIAVERNERMAPLKLQLNEIAKTRFELPDGIEPTLDAVRAARRQRVSRTGEAHAELAAIERDLAAEGRVTASALSLERELADRRERLAAVEARAEAYRHAYAFVADAYEAFRTTDEERLLGAISAHLDAVTAGGLGPMSAESGLDEATVRSGERELPLSSPPLSYGQLHAALLSVRLGAADFLAGLGVGLPLLIDDPFVHLDERATRDLWTVLCRAAADRQVIVATQDRLVLDHLGVTPDLELEMADAECDDGPGAGRVRSPSRRTPERPVGESLERDASAANATTGSNRVDDEVLDLWGDADDLLADPDD